MQFDIEQLTRFSNARLQRNDGIGLNKDRSVAIVYEVPLAAGTDTITWLQDNRRTIRDVIVDHQEVNGLWRSVSFANEQSVDKKGFVRITQTFKYGFIDSLTLDDEIVWDEARLVRSNTLPQGTEFGEFPTFTKPEADPFVEEQNPQQYHIVEWHGVNPEKIEDIREAVRSTPPQGVNPVINGENYGAGFFVLDVISEIVQDEQQPDKSGKITAIIAKPRFSLQGWENYNTPAQAKVYFLYDVPVLIAQSLINLYNMRTGTSVQATQPNQMGLLTLTIKDKIDEDTDDSMISATSCAGYTLTTYYSGLTKPEDVPDNSMGITYRGRFDLIRQEGTYSGWIEKTVAQTQKVGPYRSQETHGFYEETTTYRRVWLNTVSQKYESASLQKGTGDPVDIELTLTQIEELPDSNIDKGETWRLNKRVNEDCTYDIEYTERFEKDVPDIEYDTSDSAAAKGTAKERFNKESAEVTLVAGANEVLRANVRVNKDTGLLDVTEEKTVSKQLDGDETEENLFQKRIVTRKRNTDQEPQEPVQETGKVKSVSKEETEFQGRYNVTESVVEANPVPEVSKSKTTMPFEVRESVTNRNQLEPLPFPEEQVIGRVDEVRNDKNEFGLYDTTESSRIATPQQGAEKTKRETKFVVETGDTDRNQTERIEEQVSFEDGKIKQTRSIENEYGLYDNTKNESEAKEKDWSYTSEQNNAQLSEVEVERNADNKMDAEDVDGKMVRVQSVLNDFGKFDNQKETITPKLQSVSVGYGGGLSTTSEESARNADAAPVLVGGDGIITRVNARKNDFGKVDYTASETTAQSKSATANSGGPLVASVENVVRNANQPASPGAGADGEIKDVSNSINEFGLYDTREVTRTAKAKSASATSGGPLVRVEESLKRNASQEENPGEGAEGTINDVSNSINEFGLYDTRKVTRTALPKDSDASDGGPLSKREIKIFKNSQSPRSPGAGAAGTVKQVSNTINEFGCYDGQEVTVTAEEKQVEYVSGGPIFTQTERTHRNKTAVVNPGVGGVGVVKQASNSINEFGLYDAKETEIQANPETKTFTIFSKGETKTVTVFRNASNVPQPSNAFAANQLSYRVNDYGLLDGTLVEQNTANTAADFISGGHSGPNTYKTYRRVAVAGADGKKMQDQYATITETILWSVAPDYLSAHTTKKSYATAPADSQVIAGPSISVTKNATGRTIFVTSVKYRKFNEDWAPVPQGA